MRQRCFGMGSLLCPSIRTRNQAPCPAISRPHPLPSSIRDAAEKEKKQAGAAQSRYTGETLLEFPTLCVQLKDSRMHSPRKVDYANVYYICESMTPPRLPPELFPGLEARRCARTSVCRQCDSHHDGLYAPYAPKLPISTFGMNKLPTRPTEPDSK
jgi:hypothetical protein